MAEELKLMIVAGESSGDTLAARLLSAIKRDFPDKPLVCFGSAGERMKSAGVEALVDAESLAVIGGLEIARELPMFLSAFRKLLTAAENRRPDAVILVDLPEFNLRLARSLKKRGFRVIYYVSPQVWAWKKYRVRAIRKYVDLLLSILPFEKKFFEDHGFDRVEYVGNPHSAEVVPSCSKAEFCARHRLDPGRPIVSLLGGSRRVEMTRIMPVLLEAAKRLRDSVPGIQFVIPLAPARTVSELEEAAAVAEMRQGELDSSFTVVSGETYEALNASDASAVTSGTATLEAAIIGTPLVVVYRTSGLNYFLLRPLISIDVFGLVNLIAGRKIAEEMIQGDLTAENLSAEIVRILEPARNREIRKELESVRELLGTQDASARAAELVMKEVGRQGNRG